jgi:hypothetical protein
MTAANDLLPYVGYVLDTALSPDRKPEDIHPGAVLVGWQCGFEPMVVAVVSAYGPKEIDEDEAVDIARDYLIERKWFADLSADNEPDYVVTVE